VGNPQRRSALGYRACIDDALSMRLYHFLDRTFGLEDIRRRRVKIATLNELNDPFEMLAMTFGDPELRRAFRTAKEQMAERAGLLCFSRDWRNPVQWSHYADRHRGVCLAFDVPEQLTKAVTYSPKRLSVDRAMIESNGPAAEAFMQAVVSTKFSHWRYENEVRMFVALEDRNPETGLWLKEFGTDLVLAEVIVGAACDVTRGELADALCDLDRSVARRKARLSFKRFAVVTQMRSASWT
jgi:hypothetical protein